MTPQFVLAIHLISVLHTNTPLHIINETSRERLRKHQRALEKTQRELDRERVKLENQEKKLIQDIKKSAKNGQMGACKIQAKDLVRTRR